MNTKPLIGLALRAGASRGWAHIGVIRRLEEAGIVPDIVCGTSSGALVGGFYSAGRLNVLEDWVRGLSLRRILSFVRVRYACSLFGKSMLRQLATHGREVTLGELQVRFAAVAVDLASGREVRIERGSLVRAVAASGACPVLFPPIKVDGRWMLDGVLVEPVPVAACRALGADFVIAVTPFGSRREDRASATVASVYAKTLAKTLRGAMGVLSRLVPRKVARAMRLKEVKMRRSIRHLEQPPSGLMVMMRSVSMRRRLRGRRGTCASQPDLLIEPRPVRMIGVDQAARAIEAGRQAAEMALRATRDGQTGGMDWAATRPSTDTDQLSRAPDIHAPTRRTSCPPNQGSPAPCSCDLFRSHHKEDLP